SPRGRADGDETAVLFLVASGMVDRRTGERRVGSHAPARLAKLRTQRLPRIDAFPGNWVLDAYGRGYDAAAGDRQSAVYRYRKSLGETSPGHRGIRCRLFRTVAGPRYRVRAASPDELDSHVCRTCSRFRSSRAVAENGGVQTRADGLPPDMADRASRLARGSRLCPLR